jgi:hypothetical protein
MFLVLKNSSSNTLPSYKQHKKFKQLLSLGEKVNAKGLKPFSRKIFGSSPKVEKRCIA